MTTTFESLNAGDGIEGPTLRSAANPFGCFAMPRSITTRCISTTIT